ncbi:MAG: SAM-dependent methyltransferase [Nitrospiraceae bacterium]
MRREQSQGNEAPSPRHCGILYLIGVPIGHPDDLTIRALRVLRNVDVIAAKRPRATEALLSHHGMTSRLTSYDRETADEKVPVLLDYLERGRSIALVSDCGMPGIYDVGELLVCAAASRGIAIETIPGPSACTAGLALSGLSGNSFMFEGAVPTGCIALQRFVAGVIAGKRTTVVYPRPRQVKPILKLLAGASLKKKVILLKDLTLPGKRFSGEPHWHYSQNGGRLRIRVRSYL